MQVRGDVPPGSASSGLLLPFSDFCRCVTVDGRNSATVGRFPGFPIFEFLLFFEFLEWICVLGGSPIDRRLL